MSYAALRERIDRGEVIVMDGATGTELQRRGVPMDQAAWSAAALLSHPEVVRAVHRDYVEAGADIVIADSFGASRHVLEPAGLGDKTAELNRRAVELAREACAGAGRPVYVAGSISSFVAESDYRNRPGAEALRASYREQAGLLAEAEVDFLILEMMRDIDQSRIAVAAAAATGLPVWVGFTCTVARDEKTVLLRGDPGKQMPLAEAFGPVMAEGGSVVAVMHGEVEDTPAALQVVFERWNGPVAAYPHSGGWKNPNWQFDNIVSPEAFAAAARGWVAKGVQVVGGCCGIGPEHIRALKQSLPARLPPGARGARP